MKTNTNVNCMTDTQFRYVAQHTCQWCQAVLVQGRRFLDSLENLHGDLPWDKNEKRAK